VKERAPQVPGPGRITKIIHIIETRFTERDFQRLGIRNLEGKGFSVEIWNILPISHPEVMATGLPVPAWAFEGHTLFTSRRMVGNAILRLDPSSTLAICFAGYSFKTYFIHLALSRRGVPYGIFMANALPIPDVPGTMALVRVSAGKLLDSLLTKAILRFYRVLGIRPAALCLAGGLDSLAAVRQPWDETTDVLWIHALDYDVYLEAREDRAPVDDHLGIFLDDNLIFDLDLVYFGGEPPSPPGVYYGRLNRFFDLVEDRFGIHIRVASHPGSDYSAHPKIFGGRPIVKGRTASLVRSCGLVLAHGSTAINFAVLFERPVLFITDTDIRRHSHGPYIEKMASLLGKKPVDVDDPGELDQASIWSVDRDAYRRYRNLYIKRDGTPELPFWEVFANYLKR